MRPDFRALFGAVLLFLILLSPGWAQADNWTARIYDDGTPAALVGVDKGKHIFNYFEKNSPLRLRYTYPCVTGQLPGDKQKLNDLRTPEGIYFVEYKIANGLDFREYGGLAYTLNYPNPVDRLRGKTGYGIWIHSKGFDLAPTKGCVAIGLESIKEVGPFLAPGTPVVLAETLEQSESPPNPELVQLCGLMEQWSQAWAARSPRMFDFYDPAAYSLATENFDFFRKNKERLFSILSFIRIFNREIHALEGPGYWVTWSEQLYAASNLSTEGVRRLYWQKNDKGDFKIVGMEWTPRDVGMEAAYKQGKLVASNVLPIPVESESPVPARLDMPEQPALPPAPATVPAEPGKPGLPPAIEQVETVAALSDPLVPVRRPRPDKPDEIRWGIGQAVADVPETAPEPAPAISGASGNVETADTPPEPEAASVSAESEAAQADPLAEMATVKNLQADWLRLYGQPGEDVETFYDKAAYNRTAGVPRGRSLASTLRAIQQDKGQPWLRIFSREPELQAEGDCILTTQDLFFAGPKGIREGRQKQWWHKNDEGDWKIVSSEFTPGVHGLEANYLEEISAQIAHTVEAWRKAWEGGRLPEYLDFYTADAVQQGRAGKASIRQQKERLWTRIKPALVQLSGLRLALTPQGVRADMNQTYADSAGHTDKGIKTLLLRYDGQNWQIRKEDWTALQAAQ